MPAPDGLRQVRFLYAEEVYSGLAIGGQDASVAAAPGDPPWRGGAGRRRRWRRSLRESPVEAGGRAHSGRANATAASSSTNANYIDQHHIARFYGRSQPSTGKTQVISMKQVLETTPGVALSAIHSVVQPSDQPASPFVPG